MTVGVTALFQYIEAEPSSNASGFVAFDPQYPSFLQVSYTDYQGNDQSGVIKALQNGDSIACVNGQAWTITSTSFLAAQATFGITPAQSAGKPPGVYNFTLGAPAAVVPPTKVYPQFRWFVDVSGNPVGYLNMDHVTAIVPSGTGATVMISNRTFEVTEDPDTIVGISWATAGYGQSNLSPKNLKESIFMGLARMQNTQKFKQAGSLLSMTIWLSWPFEYLSFNQAIK
jgi:hypothetical protein